MGKLPDFIIVGAQKCGTTSMIMNLSKHSEIFVPEYSVGAKEMHFFNNLHGSYDQLGLEWYKEQFREQYTCGEKTPDYIISPTAISRIAHDVPSVKLIFAVRNPINRFFSQLNMRRHRGITFEHAIGDPEYIQRGMFGDQLALLLRHFQKTSIHVVVVDEFQTEVIKSGMLTKDEVTHTGFKRVDPTCTTKTLMNGLLEFLDLSPEKLHYEFFHVAATHFSVTPEQQERLRAIYADDMELFFELIGRRVDAWDHGHLGRYKR